MTKKRIIRIAESLEWGVDFFTGKDSNGKTRKFVRFSQCSPAEQDFSVELEYKNLGEVAELLYRYYEDYDPSEEASLWLDESGHGKNGAPHDMGDVYKDMVWCEEKTYELYEALAA